MQGHSQCLQSLCLKTIVLQLWLLIASFLLAELSTQAGAQKHLACWDVIQPGTALNESVAFKHLLTSWVMLQSDANPVCTHWAC
jgi:hypothetical protein